MVKSHSRGYTIDIKLVSVTQQKSALFPF